MTTATIGEVSTGTLRTEDLLRAYAEKLTELDTLNEYLDLRQDAKTVDPDSEEGTWVLNETADALQEFAPDYVYFGSLEGDGSCFGFWPDVEGVMAEEDITKCDDLSIAPNVPYCAVVNDHGNVTLYQGQVVWTEVWAVV